MQLRAEEISAIIKTQIQNYEKAALTTETGTVLSVGDGIARIYGLEGAMAGELLEFPGNLMGLVLNLEADNVGAVLFGEWEEIVEGDIVKRTGQLLEVPVGTDELVLLVPPSHRLADRRQVSMEDIAEERVVAHNDPSPARERVLRLFENAEPPVGDVISAVEADVALTVTVVNPHASESRECAIAVRGAAIREGRASVLTSTDLRAHNSFEHPNALAPALIKSAAVFSETPPVGTSSICGSGAFNALR